MACRFHLLLICSGGSRLGPVGGPGHASGVFKAPSFPLQAGHSYGPEVALHGRALQPAHVHCVAGSLE